MVAQRKLHMAAYLFPLAGLIPLALPTLQSVARLTGEPNYMQMEKWSKETFTKTKTLLKTEFAAQLMNTIATLWIALVPLFDCLVFLSPRMSMSEAVVDTVRPIALYMMRRVGYHMCKKHRMVRTSAWSCQTLQQPAEDIHLCLLFRRLSRCNAVQSARLIQDDVAPRAAHLLQQSPSASRRRCEHLGRLPELLSRRLVRQRSQSFSHKIKFTPPRRAPGRFVFLFRTSNFSIQTSPVVALGKVVPTDLPVDVTLPPESDAMRAFRRFARIIFYTTDASKPDPFPGVNKPDWRGFEYMIESITLSTRALTSRMPNCAPRRSPQLTRLNVALQVPTTSASSSATCTSTLLTWARETLLSTFGFRSAKHR
jgi:hypothetical protein